MLQKIRTSRRDVGKKYKNVFDDGVKGYLIHTLADQKGKIRDIGIMLIPLTFDFKFSSGATADVQLKEKVTVLTAEVSW